MGVIMPLLGLGNSPGFTTQVCLPEVGRSRATSLTRLCVCGMEVSSGRENQIIKVSFLENDVGLYSLLAAEE